MNSKINVGLYAFSGGFDRWKGACGYGMGKGSSENGCRAGFSKNPNLKVFRRPRFNLKPTPSPVRRERMTLWAARIRFCLNPQSHPHPNLPPARRGKGQVAVAATCSVGFAHEINNMRPLQNTPLHLPPPTAETKTQVFGCFHVKYPLFSPRIPHNQASGPPFRRQQAHLAC